MLSTREKPHRFSLKSVFSWPSFEKLRVEGAKALENIKEGNIGSLTTKTGQYRIIEESDFQKMYGLAQDTNRLRAQFLLITVALRAAEESSSKKSLVNDVMQAVMLLGDVPSDTSLKSIFESLEPETSEIEEDDEVTLNPNEIERPL